VKSQVIWIGLGFFVLLAALLVTSVTLICKMWFCRWDVAESLMVDRWKPWARATAIVQVAFFFVYPAFITDGFVFYAVPVGLVPVVWGFYTYFFYRTRREHLVGWVNGALSIFWLFIAWDSNIKFLFEK
jgi:hypothetical protein